MLCNSKYLYYYSNGQLWSKSNWKDGQYDGEHLEYHENGDLNITEIFKDGKLIERIEH